MEPIDPDRLPAIKRELAFHGVRLAFEDADLEARYNRQRLARGRRLNRVGILATIVLFDLFIFGEIRPCPEVLVLSAVFRFAIVTPACLLFLFLDSRKKLGRCSEAAITATLYLPTLFGALECFAIHHVEALTNFQSIPLIQLAILTCRVGVRHTLYSVGLACLTYIAIACSHGVYVPAVAVPSLALTDIAIGVAVLVFSIRLDHRERQVFLFELQSEIGRNMLAVQNEKLSRLTRMDALTGLGNRRCFDELLDSLWSDARTRNAPVTLIMFDIDYFKQYNDTLGHRAGDECLAMLARTVAQSLRDDCDKLARYGGEEFAIVLPGSRSEEGLAIAERVRRAVLDCAMPHPGSGPAGVVTVSLGVASVVPAHQPAAALIEMADCCLYNAKRGGRNMAVTDQQIAVAADIPVLPPPVRAMQQTALLHEV